MALLRLSRSNVSFFNDIFLLIFKTYSQSTWEFYKKGSEQYEIEDRRREEYAKEYDDNYEERHFFERDVFEDKEY